MENSKKRILSKAVKKVILLIFLNSIQSVYAQNLEKEKQYYLAAIGFWNVENLYDTLNDRWKNDEEFTPAGLNAWTGERYRLKIEHLADVISQMAMEATPDGLALIGLCEVENKNVIQDLLNSPKLKPRHYQFIHIDGPDSRGVDPSFIYNPAYFKVMKAESYPVLLVTDPAYKTRDILVVSGFFLGEPLTVLVNHWPSRRGGELASRPNRIAAAKTARHIADSISAGDLKMKLIIMGDLNDDPVNASVKEYIRTCASIQLTHEGCYFNPMEKLYREGIGTLAWNDSWNLFDQLLLNKNWIPGNYNTWQYYTVRIFNKSFLKTEAGPFKGYPLRTYSSKIYTGGYSDHFPVYMIIAKEKK